MKSEHENEPSLKRRNLDTLHQCKAEFEMQLQEIDSQIKTLSTENYPKEPKRRSRTKISAKRKYDSDLSAFKSDIEARLQKLKGEIDRLVKIVEGLFRHNLRVGTPEEHH